MRKIECHIFMSLLTPGFPDVNREDPAPLSRREGKRHRKVARGECELIYYIKFFLLPSSPCQE